MGAATTSAHRVAEGNFRPQPRWHPAPPPSFYPQGRRSGLWPLVHTFPRSRAPESPTARPPRCPCPFSRTRRPSCLEGAPEMARWVVPKSGSARPPRQGGARSWPLHPGHSVQGEE
ncbi:hypothetical protein NN561_004346 [Cricetulus griseus]